MAIPATTPSPLSVKLEQESLHPPFLSSQLLDVTDTMLNFGKPVLLDDIPSGANERRHVLEDHRAMD